jgi:fibronectin type 3 domain-containing protein
MRRAILVYVFVTAFLAFCALGARAVTLPFAVDGGGPAAESYVADVDFSGGNTSSTTATIDTSAVSNPAPQAVYQTERYGAFTYTIPGLTPNATYNVALHFAEIYWSSAGQRTFNVVINGTQVLTNFDIIAAAGAPKKAIVKSFSTTANSSGQIVIQFTNGTADLPKISGIVITVATESPYSGTAAVIPGTIQAENYDLGGEGVAYHVTSINGSGNSYRSDGVDLETTADTGGGYDLGWTAGGQWFKYTVNVATAGTYSVACRVAAAAAVGTTAGSFHIQNASGTNLSGAVSVPGTGGWQTWSTINATVTLPAGTQTIEVYQDTGGFNFNYFKFSQNSPAAPSALTASAGNGQVTLSWTGSAGATSYNVYRGTSAGGEGSTAIATGVTGTSFVNTGLTNGTAYYYKVAAVSGGGTSAMSNEASATPLPPTPSAPTGLAASAADTKVTLSWTASSGATSYNVYRGTTAGGESTTPVASNLTAGTTYTDTGLTDGTAYYYVVKAVNQGGVSPASNEASATPEPPAPAAPTGLAATAGNSSVSVAWTASSGATSYNVYRGTTAGGESVIPVATGITTAAYTDSAVTNGTTYYYTVAAVNVGGTSAMSNEASATPQSPVPPAPAGLSAIGGNTQVLLNWTASANATSYNIYRGATGGGELSTAIATGVTAVNYADTGVTNGTTYYYVVKAVDGAGISAASNEASAIPHIGAPVGGVYAQLPGTLQMENYDSGGQGIGYSVGAVNGNANYYRPDGVDLETCFDDGNGYDVGWASAGQWFSYTVEVNNAGAYTVSFRVAGSGGTCHLLNAAGVSLTGPVTVPNTNGWQNWSTITANVTLPAGVQTLTFYEDTGGYNINYMTFAYKGTAGPTGLAASGQNQQVYLLWNAISGATSYNLYRSTSPGGEGTTPVVTGISGATYTDTAVTNGVTYYYQVAAVSSSGVTGLSNESSATPTTEGPYGGTPWAIPGTVQVENYDVGGLGVGYNDADPTNDGGQYRSDGVDIEYTGDLSGGYDVGWTGAGEWLNYTVNVTGGGNYVAQVRIASNGPGGTFHFNVDGVSATSEVTIPDTGGWQVWDTLSTPITLTAGQHVVRLVLDSNGSGGGVGNFNWFTIGPAPASPNFGSNVFIFNPSMPASSMQKTIDTVYEQQQFSQFGSNRCALLFQPGAYNVDVPVGYYTQVLGLGQLPDGTTINGYVQQNAALNGNNATCNFWTGMENLAINPVDSGGTDQWAVSQADPVRRVHVKGNLVLAQNWGYGSGGFLADSVIDGQVNSESQQQWISRNDQWGSWSGSSWNMVFVGDTNSPSGTFPSPPYTVIGQTPAVREKPTLTVDANGNYSVFVSATRTVSQGTTWGAGSPAGQYIPISKFYIAQPGVDNASSINAALSQGMNLILTPGMYILNGTIQVTQPNTVVLGLGLPTLVAKNGITALSVADVDGVVVAGVMIDASTPSSPVLMQVGPAGSTVDHSANPTTLDDLFFRVGGGEGGQATVSLQINSNNVICDDIWAWRADHGNGVGWTNNTAANGVVVNGNNVTMYGLAVEHYQQYQTLWNGNGGQLYFYQCECPYDVPNQSGWMDGTINGYAAYKVSNSVTSHQAYGLGIYCNFWNNSVVLDSAIEAPTTGSNFTDMVTISLGGQGQITHIVNGAGNTVNSSSGKATLMQYP